KLEFKEHLKTPYPDLKCDLNDSDLYIEVAHAYGTSVDVRKVLRRDTSAEPSAEEDFKNTVSLNMDDRIVEPLNETIREHCNKDYMGEPCWLLVRIGNPLYDTSEFERFINRIEIPSNNKFNEIWILCGPWKECGALQIWPTT
ncbi:MAG: hypothetical protein RLO81_20140, partial [Fulvivirga sp.]|uniref:hypothetical protein n=1 Tax=Fulvivirga sp. TaxID=1931237 RepID=UPI0032EDBABD